MTIEEFADLHSLTMNVWETYDNDLGTTAFTAQFDQVKFTNSIRILKNQSDTRLPGVGATPSLAIHNFSQRISNMLMEHNQVWIRCPVFVITNQESE